MFIRHRPQYAYNLILTLRWTVDSVEKLPAGPQSGILQTCAVRENEPNPYGTTVTSKVNAQYHQHIFSLRVDPMVDGPANSVLETGVVSSL